VFVLCDMSHRSTFVFSGGDNVSRAAQDRCGFAVVVAAVLNIVYYNACGTYIPTTGYTYYTYNLYQYTYMRSKWAKRWRYV